MINAHQARWTVVIVLYNTLKPTTRYAFFLICRDLHMYVGKGPTSLALLYLLSIAASIIDKTSTVMSVVDRIGIWESKQDGHVIVFITIVVTIVLGTWHDPSHKCVWAAWAAWAAREHLQKMAGSLLVLEGVWVLRTFQGCMSNDLLSITTFFS